MVSQHACTARATPTIPAYCGSTFLRATTTRPSVEELTWDEFFEKFDDQRLAFVYQERTAAGARSRLNRFVSR